MSVADNERDAVLLHVSASSERQNGKRNRIKEENTLNLKTPHDYVTFLQVILAGYTVTFTSYLMSDYHITKNTFLKLLSNIVKQNYILEK